MTSRAQEAKLQQEHQAKLAREQRLEEKLQTEPKQLSTNIVDHHVVYVQNEHLDLAVGPLPKRYRKAIDPVSGRCARACVRFYCSVWLSVCLSVSPMSLAHL